MQSSLLPVNFPLDTFVDKIRHIWSFRYNSVAPQDTAATKQRSWDDASIRDGLAILTERCSDDVSKARLLASQAPHSGDWLNAMPVSSCGLRLDNEAIRAIGLRLGVNLCAPHACPCGAAVDALGIHGLSCRRSAGRFTRHSMLNDLLTRACIRSGVPAVKEPNGLFPSDEKRPDGVSLVPWRMGRCIAWDVTCPDTLAASHRLTTSVTIAAAAERAALLKHIKYAEIEAAYDFVPVAIETLGPINSEGMAFLDELGNRLSIAARDTREATFLYQRVSVCIQRANAIAFRGSFVEGDLDD